MDLKAFDDINDVLKKALKADPGIKKIILTDRTGITIAHASKSLEYLVEIDELGVIASHIFCASKELGQNLELSDLSIITLEFDDGRIRIAACGNGIISFFTERDVCVIRLLLKSLENELIELIDKYLKDPIIEAHKLNKMLSEAFFNVED
ncbi:MAG: roadblock/LC7 domain-containing protein [Candidatus Helarchaeota archaeon]|nr:roadblock/LC7 domain-containing protein [Candidatus Helarchaeota archaeon]